MADTTTRLWVAGILAGLALIGVVAFVVLGPGRFNPAPPSLSDHPVTELNGRIAYVNSDGCIQIVEAETAAEREVYCGAARPSGITFLNGETLALITWTGERNPRWTAVDIATGNTTDLGTFPDPGFQHDPTLGGRIFIATDGEIFVDENGERRSIYDASYPEYYQPRPIAISPDGDWLIVSYAPPRENDQHIWLIAMDGSAARTLTKDADYDMRAVSWWIDGLGAAPEFDTPSPPAAFSR